MRVRAIYRDKILKPKRKLALAEGEEVTIDIRKSKVEELAGLMGDIDIDSVELQHMTKEVSMPMVYKEILEVKKKLETIEEIIIPTERVSDEELDEIMQLKEESLKGEYVKWTELKKELSG